MEGFGMTLDDLPLVEPLLVVAFTAIVVLLSDLILIGRRKGFAFVLSLLGLLYALVKTIALWNVPAVETPVFGGFLALDRMGLVFDTAILTAALFTVMLSRTYMRRTGTVLAEYYVLLLCTVMGMMIIAQTADLIVLFLGIELLSIPLYVLAAFLRKRRRSVESGMKYFLLGAFSSSILIYGIALLYGAAGSTRIAGVALALTGGGGADPVILKAGCALFIAALGFKVAAVPFHMWAPDVYEGAPTPITAFMATAVKTAGFAALVRVFVGFAGMLGESTVTSLLAAVALATMVVGNLGALPQTNIKRMLAYSSIAHAGYLLVGVAALTAAPAAQAPEAVLFYLLAYTFTNLGAFAVVIFLTGKKGEYNEISDFAGLAVRHPVLALTMAVFMFTLTGLPPTAGFFGKFFLFKAAVDAGMVWLAVAGVLLSIVSLFYYVRVVAFMYLKPSEDAPPRMEQCPWLAAVSVLSVAGVLLLGIFPQALIATLFAAF